MSGETTDETIFAGAAPYYALYRLPYPADLISDIVAHYGLDGTGRMLDLGCGPGTLTLPLAPHVESVLALDISPEMIDEARRASSQIDWRVMPAEEISPALGTFRLVTCGSSFHWMDRDLVLARVKEMLAPGGSIALAAGFGGSWEGKEDWQQTTTAIVKRYLGEPRRAGRSGFARYVNTNERFEECLPRNGWTVEMYRDYPREIEWDVDSLIGFIWSTSFASRPHFGDRVDEFETELRGELLRLRPDGRFRETGEFGLVCGRP
jgi:trans-aconitate methyltransferase